MAARKTASDALRKSRSKITECLRKNPDVVLDQLDSRLLITKEEYLTLDEIENSDKKVRAIINSILKKGEAQCESFLLLLQDLKNYFPELDPVMSGAAVESSSQKKDSENQCTPQSIEKATPGEQIETWRILRFFYQLWRIFCTIIFKSLLFLGLSSRAAVEEPKDNHLHETISSLGLEDYVSEKLTLSSVLEVSVETITDANIQTLRNLPWNFLKKLMVLNNTARNTHYTTGTSADETQLNPTNIGDMFTDIKIDSNQSINPLDVVTTLFLSSDCLLQQQIMLKMSMCQFALPLLLPDYRSDNCVLLQWVLREIVKKWRPQSLESCKGFKEENLAVTSMPTISFVRLGNCTLSKSKLLNDVLSSLQQQNNFFIHHNMQCGNVPRRISDGLVEICWYLPCGKKKLDAFPEAFAITNLRGDARSKSIQFEFMRKISTAVFVFVESIDKSIYKSLSSIDKSETQYFFILSSQNSKEKVTLDYLKKLATNLQLEPKHLLRKSNQMNEADFVRKVQETIKDVLKRSSIMKNVEEMAVVARELKIQVDEDDEKCSEARMHAEEITSKIQNVGDYKKKVLPLQGNILKELAQLEKEMHRLRKHGHKPFEEYKCDLENKIMKLREKQNQYEPSEGILSFITALVDKSTEERHYFLKWMKFFLDTVARENLSDLREKYKTQYKGSQDHDTELTELDQKIADSSLGLEHFMREIGQIYEAESLLIDKGKLTDAQIQFAHLANVAAELMLEGYPLEIIDGDASHVPVRWVTDVLKQLKTKMGNSSRIRVITVLGVQSTGKSTLLNTMFGLQFAVSSGRCTRGAFMLLIRVKEGFRKILSCDFLLVIDTEGLKSPELAKLDDSYEHDNELATLVVGLSDITLINMAMENSTEMKDILQIVVHAFLRMKETGKKPNCQFVHQNVGDVSAHDQNMRDRKLLLEQLNEMTKAAAKMEKKDSYSKFSDVMEYDAEKDNWYIPGLWHGIPPMASVNTGYSENVYELKRSLFKTLKQKKQRSLDILEFNEWVKSLWNAVKYENFIFNFRNSLVADAYNQLCINYAEWEWEFRKNMHCWLLEAENRIHNQLESELGGFFQALKAEAYEKLQNEEKKMLEKLENYFQSNGANVHLVERYRETFFKSANLLKTELEGHVLNKCEETLNICKSVVKFDKVQSEARETIEKEVTRLLNTCRNSERNLDSEQLIEMFEKMWRKTLSEKNFIKIEKQNIEHCVYVQLRRNLQNKAGQIQQKLNKAKNLHSFGEKHFVLQKSHLNITWFARVHEWFTHETASLVEKETEALVETCTEFVSGKLISKLDYDDEYSRELLHIVENRIQRAEFEKFQTTSEYECDVKLHICGMSVRFFQEMHDRFVEEHDPVQHLERMKPTYLSLFQDSYSEKDQCQKRAKQFCDLCLQPALLDYVHKHLGLEIIQDISDSPKFIQYNSRFFFQFTILKDMLERGEFDAYLKYISNYEQYVKKWIIKQVEHRYTRDVKIADVEKRCLSVIIQKVKKAVDRTMSDETIETVFEFLEKLCNILEKDIVISKESLGLILFENQENIEQFSINIHHYIDDMEATLISEFEKTSNVTEKLTKLPIKPQDVFFKNIFGCGKQCPFCKVPCEAGGEGHEHHFASVHRPQGLGRYRDLLTNKLVPEICSTSVNSEHQFRNIETGLTFHPYKDYRKYYPDWEIQGDQSIEASDYWKYVMAQFNKQFAVAYEAEEADVPNGWRNITADQALKSLEEIFYKK
ncbi:interferon-induced very large GTPase 1-like [Latimeria chalumnae]